MLILELLHIQFHWQFLITYSGFWLVNILLQIFDISSQKKKWKREKNIFVNGKQEKNVNKVHVNIKHCVCIVCIGVSTPPQKPPPPSFLPSPTPLNRQTPSLKAEVLSSSPFWNLGWRFNLPPPTLYPFPTAKRDWGRWNAPFHSKVPFFTVKSPHWTVM